MSGATKKDLQEGFSLLEVLISIAIFTTALLGVSVMLISTIKGNSVSMHLSSATQLASKQVEEIMLMEYADLKDLDHDGLSGLDDKDVMTADMIHLRAKAGGLSKEYNIFINVAEDLPVQDTKTVRVILLWEDAGREKQTEFEFVRTLGE
ncbi:MAG: type IV pilus modification PilV family protein [bacterium]